MSVRFVNSSVPYQDGKGTFQNIQLAINASSSGDTVVLEDNQVYDLGSGQVILKNGVDLLCRNGVALIQSTHATAVCVDSDVSVTCFLQNIIFQNTLAGMGGLFTGGGTISCKNVTFQSVSSRGFEIQSGVITGAVGISASNAGIHLTNPAATVRDCSGFSTTGSGIVNEVGNIVDCYGQSNSVHGIFNYFTALAIRCIGKTNAVASGYGFNNVGSRAIGCIGYNTQQIGFLNLAEDPNDAVAVGCYGISTGNIVGSAGFQNGQANGIPPSHRGFCYDCHGISLGANGAEGMNCLEETINVECTGVSLSAITVGGIEFYGAYALNCSGFQPNQVGIAGWNIGRFDPTRNKGSVLINCSGYSNTREGLLIGGNNNEIYGGEFVSSANVANAHGIYITSDNPGTGPAIGTKIRNATGRCVNAASFSLGAGFPLTNIDYAGCNLPQGIDPQVVQISVATVDLQGNVIG